MSDTAPPRRVPVRGFVGRARPRTDEEAPGPSYGRPSRELGFLAIGLFEEAGPRGGHESTLETIRRGPALGRAAPVPSS
ncbi:hypothetical protein [Streptomyces sp. NPDC026673]|uniref:hypothetical protein n=1 Tax=Streptomyces sp. NPDC026673 TaxID=3155724 RepID=UPI0033E01C2E